LSFLPRFDQPDAWPRRRDELGEVLGEPLDLLDIERRGPSAAARKQFELVRDNRRETG
jgi:hypothetical protein